MDPGTNMGVTGKTEKIQIKYVVNSGIPVVIFSFDNCSIVMYNVNIRGSWVKNIQKNLCMTFATSP